MNRLGERESVEPVTTEKYSVRNSSGELLPPGTFFVIRGTDLFSTQALWAYVQSLVTVVELNRSANFLTAHQAEYLEAVASQATELATSWQKAGMGRLPD